ncbi:M20/M25/M40 family metallo-hydrolase [Pseudomonas sp. P105]|uniref:M20/M25/M40 family metallo-hydrolase n=1 Tax=Pseudomonas sp. P105 TaxID=3049542 RepID=UPI0039776D54
MLLGAARCSAEHRDFPGTLHFIFQPAEESLGGGRVMVAEGLFELFPCDSVYGMHNMPGIPAGDFAIREGAMMAANDTWTVAFSGTGGHGSMPSVATDPTSKVGIWTRLMSFLRTLLCEGLHAVFCQLPVICLSNGWQRSHTQSPAHTIA